MKTTDTNIKKPLTVKGNEKQLRLTIPKTYGISLAEEVAVMPYEDYVKITEEDLLTLSSELTETTAKLEKAEETIEEYKKKLTEISLETSTNKTEDTETIKKLTLEKEKLTETVAEERRKNSRLTEEKGILEEKVIGLEALLEERNDKYLAMINALKLVYTSKVKTSNKTTEERTINKVLELLEDTGRFSLFMKKFNIKPNLKIAESVSAEAIVEIEEDNKYLLNPKTTSSE